MDVLVTLACQVSGTKQEHTQEEINKLNKMCWEVVHSKLDSSKLWPY